MLSSELRLNQFLVQMQPAKQSKETVVTKALAKSALTMKRVLMEGSMSVRLPNQQPIRLVQLRVPNLHQQGPNQHRPNRQPILSELHRRTRHQQSQLPILSARQQGLSQHRLNRHQLNQPLILLELPNSDQSKTAQPAMDGLFLCAQLRWKHHPPRDFHGLSLLVGHPSFRHNSC